MDTNLYRTSSDGIEICKLCELARSDGHAKDCGGRVLDGLYYEILVEGDNCTRGCCGYTNTRVRGASLEMIVEDAVRAGSEAVSPSFGARAVCDMALPNAWLKEARERIEKRRADEEAAEKAKEAAEERKRSHAYAIEQLECDKPDLSPEGYARRRAEIVEEFGEAESGG